MNILPRVQKDDNGRPRGFGFVSFDAPTSAQVRPWRELLSFCICYADPRASFKAVLAFCLSQAAIAGMSLP